VAEAGPSNESNPHRAAALVLALVAVPIASMILAPPAAAFVPVGNSWVEVRLSLSLDTPSAGRVDGNFSFFLCTLNGTSLPADAIRAGVLWGEGGQFRQNLESAASSMLSEQFHELFPQDALTGIECRLDNASLVDSPGTDAYHPPVLVHASGAARISPASIGLPAATDLDRLEPLVLADGVELRRELLLNASAGQLVEVSLGSFPGSVFNETGSGSMLLSLENINGTSPACRGFVLTLRAAAASAPAEEALQVRGTVDLQDFYTVRVLGSIEFLHADPRGYWTPPPGVLNLTAVSGATLSELARAGILSTKDVYEFAVVPVQNSLRSRLETLLNVTLVFAPDWSEDGNLTCTMAASSIGHALFGPPPELVLGALNAGATFRFATPVDVGWPLEIEFIVPGNLRLGGLPPDGETTGRMRYRWSSPDGRGEIAATLFSASSAQYSGDDVRVEVLADFGTPELDPLKLVSSGSADVPVQVEARLMMGTIAVPAAIAGYLPSNLTLAYLTPDLLRLLLADGYIGEDEMGSLLQQVQTRIDGPMRSALGGSARPSISYFQDSLKGYDLNRMDGSRPVEIQARASGHRTKHIDLFKSVRVSHGLATMPQDFAFRGVAGWNVTYRMRFAPETRLTDLRVSGARAVRGSGGGRDYFEVSFGREGGSANVTAYLEPTAGFLLSSLGPSVCPFTVLLIVILVFAALRVRRRRIRRREAHRLLRDAPARRPR
jgi:hypothetical protein